MSYTSIHHDGIVLEAIHNYYISSPLLSKYMTELQQQSFDFVKYEEMKKKIQKSKPKSDITYQKREQLLPKLTKSKFRKN